MPVVTLPLEDALALLDRADRAESPAIAFDCDGTLWSGDVGDDWFEQLVTHEGLADAARSAIREEARSHGLSDDGGDDALGRALVAGSKDGRYPEERLFGMMAWASAGRPIDSIAAIVDRSIARCGLAERVHGETLALLERARALGITRVAVSASPRPVIERSLDHLGIHPEFVCAAEASERDGVVLPELRAELPYGPEKVRALQRVLGARPVLVALGDSAFDLPMLEYARVGLMVRPRAALVAAALGKASVVALARLESSRLHPTERHALH